MLEIRDAVPEFHLNVGRGRNGKREEEMVSKLSLMPQGRPCLISSVDTLDSGSNLVLSF
jgi:hypothetical protein